MATRNPYNYYGTNGMRSVEDFVSYINSSGVKNAATPSRTQAAPKPKAPPVAPPQGQRGYTQEQKLGSNGRPRLQGEVTRTPRESGGTSASMTLGAAASGASPQNQVTRTERTGASTGGAGGGNIATMAAQTGGSANPSAGPSAAAAAAASGDGLGTGKTTTEFGGLFKPEAYNEAWGDPNALINTYLNFRDAPTSGGGAAMTQELADNMNLMFLLMNEGKNATDLGHNAYLDWSGQYLDNMRTPGATAPGMHDVVNAILNPTAGGVMDQNLYGKNMTANDQVSAVLEALSYGGRTTGPSLVMQSLLSQAAQMGEDYRAAQLTGQNDINFGEYLRQNNFMGR